MARGGRWRGDEVRAKVHRASAAAINEVLADAVAQAKGNHPGWQNRTANAEGSIRVVDTAAAQGARMVGRWGSVGVVYFRRLEFEHGGALRGAADVTYPGLAPAIRRRMG